MKPAADQNELAKQLWPESAVRTEAGSVAVGGVSLNDLAAKHGTPLYVVDEKAVRSNAGSIHSAFAGACEKANTTGAVYYATKALLTAADGAHVDAAASALGVALGFGAQTLVKDYLSGIFLIIEDQYGVGDTVDRRGRADRGRGGRRRRSGDPLVGGTDLHLAGWLAGWLGGRLGGWLDALQRLQALQADWLIGQHTVAGPGQVNAALQTQREALCVLARFSWQALEQGLTEAEALARWPQQGDGAAQRQSRFNLMRAWREVEALWLAHQALPVACGRP